MFSFQISWNSFGNATSATRRKFVCLTQNFGELQKWNILVSFYYSVACCGRENLNFSQKRWSLWKLKVTSIWVISMKKIKLKCLKIILKNDKNSQNWRENWEWKILKFRKLKNKLNLSLCDKRHLLYAWWWIRAIWLKILPRR